MSGKPPTKYIEGEVIKIADGDTITVLTLKNKKVKIRIYGIDAPEKKQRYGEEATKFVRKKLLNKNVVVEVVGIGRYKRKIGIVYYGSIFRKNLSKQLVKNGLAWRYPQYCKKAKLCSELEKLENKARKRKKGLWKDKGLIPPWTWRRIK